MNLDNLFSELGINEVDYAKSMLSSYVTEIVLFLVGYVFKVIAIYVMAKRRGIKKLYMCFIPFLNFVVLGKLVGTVNVWGVRFKNLGLWLAITSAVTFVTDQVIYLRDYVFVLERVFLGGYIEFESQLIINLLAGEGIIYSIISTLNTVSSLAQLFFEVSLIFTVFRLYKPEKATLFALLSIFLGNLLFGILLFAIRNNKYITIDDFMRIRAEQARAKYNAYYGSNNGYNANNGWNNQYNAQNTSYEEKEPFPEFSDNKTNGDSRKKDQADASKEDDLFN